MRKSRRPPSHLPEKANKILNGVLVFLLLISIKSWHLAIVLHDKKIEESKKPQRRVVVERSERAAIYDRFDLPLAINKVQYNASVIYGPIRDLPRTIWRKNDDGKRVKILYRKEYIRQLAQKLAEELQLDSEWLEDLIHSKAAILGNVPCLVKQNISEEQYFRLSMLEKEWPGILAEVGAKRYYPSGPIGGEVVGYIGPISRTEYDAIVKEIANLREMLNRHEEGERVFESHSSHYEVAARLEELEKKAYRINDFVGKTGVEAYYDEELRGLCGKKIYLSDIKGNYLSKLPGSEEPTPGKKLNLTLSIELQEYASKLLAQYEGEPASAVAPSMRPLIAEKQPWIKGGAIVAMDPNNGEILALTSFPSFDPNDFIRTGDLEEDLNKNKKVNQWLETEEYLTSLWDMQTPFSRSYFTGVDQEESVELNWPTYLSLVLPEKSKVRALLQKATVKDALFVQHQLNALFSLFQEAPETLSLLKIINYVYDDPQSIQLKLILTIPEKTFLQERQESQREKIQQIKAHLSLYFSELPSNYDKVLLADLLRITVDDSLFQEPLRNSITMSLSYYREASARFVTVASAVKNICRELFLESDYKRWREENFSSYLEAMREKEVLEKRYAKPYLDYIEKSQQEEFQKFWQTHQWELICFFLSEKTLPEKLFHYQKLLADWATEIKNGAHKALFWVDHFRSLTKVTKNFDVETLAAFLKTLRSYETLNRPLIGHYSGLRGKLEKDLATAFYPAYGYGFARSHAFRQAATIGSIFKLVPAYEALRQRYENLKSKGESLAELNPLTIVDDKHRIVGKKENWNVGFTTDGKAIPMYYHGGRLPRSDHSGVGRVDLIKALEVSSNPYFALISGDILEDPEDLCLAAARLGFGSRTGIDLPGEYGGRIPKDVSYNRSGLYSMSIGQHSLVGTPLQTAAMLSLVANGGQLLKPHIVPKESETRWQVFLPPQIQNILLTAMRQVVLGEKGTARKIKRQFSTPLIHQIIGKTSTSEVIERLGLDQANGAMKLKHVWFGAVAYETEDFSKPELVVVVYLRYGGWGNDAAPLAVEMVKKWREIKEKHLSKRFD